MEIKVARKADITLIPAPVDGVIFGNIVFVAGKGWITWDVTGETPGTNSEPQTSREGSAKNNKLKFSAPKDRAGLRNMFDRASTDELIVLYKYGNGQQRIFGQLHTPVRFRFSHQSGTQHADKNGYECEFFYEGPDNMFEYNGAVAVAPPGAAPSIVYFNGVAIATLNSGQNLNIISNFGFTEFYITG